MTAFYWMDWRAGLVVCAVLAAAVAIAYGLLCWTKNRSS